MDTEQKEEVSQQNNGGDASTGFVGRLEAKYRKVKEDVETYPYVWASYAAVYGTFGLWFVYRWRRLRQVEDRVRALQERLRQRAQAEAEKSASASSTSAAASESASTSNVSKKPK
ncbi:hypothetical protein RND81_09G231600 [Saponaria officinalis]|uniref:Transmembrane protein n=1 Tax=Saponaria officinalis TaxID=3572 RepID=A0AAW1IPG3_SAPOF